MAQDIPRPNTPEGGAAGDVQSPVVPPDEPEPCPSPPAQDVTTPPQEKYWLPFSLRRPFLLSLAILFLLMAIAGEVMRQYSNHHHGLIHLSTYKALGLASGLVVYVPTTIAVLLVTLWNICALDVLRLEPYFQLAKPEGTSGVVLFTNYCFTYGILAPIRAFRNQHWIVAIVSAVALILRTMLPSVMSGLIVLTEKDIVSTKPINTWPNFVDLETQSIMMSNAATHSKNVSQFSADTFFFYQTHDYAIPPVVRLPEDDTESSTWKMNQTAYWADLNCVEVSLTNIIPTMQTTNSTSSSILTWDVSDIKFDHLPKHGSADCVVSFALNSDIPTGKGSSQVRHWEPLNHNSSTINSSTMNTTGCDSFALFGVGINVGPASQNFSSKGTAFGCSSAYLSGDAEIFFPVNTSFVPARLISGTNKTLSSSNVSISSFEGLVLSKYNSGNLAIPGNRHLISSLSTSTGVNGSRIRDLSPAAISDYQEDIRKLWNHNFLNSVKHFFNTTGDPTPVNARQTTDTVLYQVTSRSALIVEAVLLVASFVLFGLLYLYPRRLNFLRADPGSIAAQCAILTDIFTPTNVLTQSGFQMDRSTPRQIRRFARTLWCQWIDDGGEKRLNIIPATRDLPPLELPKSTTRRNPRPHFLTPPWFLIECAVMAGVLAAFGVAFEYVRVDKLDSSNSAGVAFIYFFLIYGPTVIASIIGSLFISIYRHLSNLEPWVRLQKGMAIAKHSLTANYGTQTPFMSWMTFRRSAPPMLILLSVMCFLDMFLTVASSGMFEPILYNYTAPTSGLSARYNESMFMNPTVRIELNGNSFISDSLLMGYSLLAWTSPDTSFFPLTIVNHDPDYDWEEYYARVRGVGANITCSDISSSSSRRNDSAGTISWTYHPAPTLDTNCTVNFQQPTTEHRLFNESVYFRGPVESSDICQRSFIVIVYDNFDSMDTTGDDNSTVFQCSPEISIRDFHIDFEYEGTIDDWEPISGSAIESGEMFENASSSLVPFTQAFIRPSWLSQQNAKSNEYDWAVLLTRDVYETLGNPDFIDPSILKQAVELGYQSTYSTYLTLWRDIYFDPVPPNTIHVNGTTTDTFYGIEPSYATIFIILVLLSIDLTVLMAVFWFRHRHYNGPQIPRSIGTLIPIISKSRMLDDIRGTADWSEAKRRKHLDQLGRKYRYGDFFLVNGEKRLALDYDQKPSDGFDDGQQLEMSDFSVDASPQADQDTDPPSAAVSTTHLINEHNDRV